MLARHPSTAKFISGKIATRFVSDNPPQELVNRMAETFIEKNGEIRQVLIAMVTSPEFWRTEALGEKTKSPFVQPPACCLAFVQVQEQDD